MNLLSFKSHQRRLLLRKVMGLLSLRWKDCRFGVANWGFDSCRRFR
ncbi:hypothetical protein HanPSC8_Chr05g0189761 [Helianthus annuus]|nr:hypothetical protein HanPSC8_Chr05g0189761 [Helianthus annuus]